MKRSWNERTGPGDHDRGGRDDAKRANFGGAYGNQMGGHAFGPFSASTNLYQPSMNVQSWSPWQANQPALLGMNYVNFNGQPANGPHYPATGPFPSNPPVLGPAPPIFVPRQLPNYVGVVRPNVNDVARALQPGIERGPPSLPKPNQAQAGPSSRVISGNKDNDNQGGSVDPWSFLALENRLAPSLQNPNNDNMSAKGREMSQLSDYMYKRFRENQQDASMFRLKMDLWGQLEKVLAKRFDCTTHVFGSTLNGFGLRDSDMDLCVFFSNNSSNGGAKNAKDEIKTLANVRKTLRREMAGRISGNMELIPAKVPILKLFQPRGSIQVDLSCNNPNSVRNTCLLYYYSQMDWRVRPLVLTIKCWAKKAGINDAKEQTLSSYCLVLMVLHFLQVGVKPPVIPAINRTTNSELFDSNSNIFNLPFKSCPKFESLNVQSLGELLEGFFDYYCDRFDFCYDVGSIRAGDTLTSTACRSYAKMNNGTPGQWSAYVLIEEPFDRTNAGRATVKRERFDLILEALKKAKMSLKNKRPFHDLF